MDQRTKWIVAGGGLVAVGLLAWAVWPKPALGPTTRTKRSIVAYRVDLNLINPFQTDEVVTIPAGASIEVLGTDDHGDVHFVWNNQNYRTTANQLS